MCFQKFGFSWHFACMHWLSMINPWELIFAIAPTRLNLPTMKKRLLIFASVITSVAIITSLYLATLKEPTEIQKQLSTTSNAIAIGGTTAIFGLLDDDHDNDKKKDAWSRGRSFLRTREGDRFWWDDKGRSLKRPYELGSDLCEFYNALRLLLMHYETTLWQNAINLIFFGLFYL